MASDLREREWALFRSGEHVLWGSGDVHLNLDAEMFDSSDDIPDIGYALVDKGPRQDGVSNDDVYAIVDEHHLPVTAGNHIGFAHGTVNHKMTPERSPDVSAVVLKRNRPAEKHQ